MEVLQYVQESKTNFRYLTIMFVRSQNLWLFRCIHYYVFVCLKTKLIIVSNSIIYGSRIQSPSGYNANFRRVSITVYHCCLIKQSC